MPVLVLTFGYQMNQKFSYFRVAQFILVISALELPDAFAENPVTFSAPTELTTRLVNRADVDLHWKNNATAPGGNWVEFTTPGDDYVKLEATGSTVTVFRHPDIAPDTNFCYRILPFFGQPTAEFLITTGKTKLSDVPDLVEGPLSFTRNLTHGPHVSIRSVATFMASAPDGLEVTLASATSVALRWNDHATDEDGYLVEVAAIGEKEFKLCALLPPDTLSFRKNQLPEQTPCRFRVRAFFYGTPSNIAFTISSAPPPPLDLKKAKP